MYRLCSSHAMSLQRSPASGRATVLPQYNPKSKLGRKFWTPKTIRLFHPTQRKFGFWFLFLQDRKVQYLKKFNWFSSEELQARITLKPCAGWVLGNSITSVSHIYSKYKWLQEYNGFLKLYFAIYIETLCIFYLMFLLFKCLAVEKNTAHTGFRHWNATEYLKACKYNWFLALSMKPKLAIIAVESTEAVSFELLLKRCLNKEPPFIVLFFLHTLRLNTYR